MLAIPVESGFGIDHAMTQKSFPVLGKGHLQAGRAGFRQSDMQYAFHFMASVFQLQMTMYHELATMRKLRAL